MTLTIVHHGLANACLIFSIVVSGYGFWSLWRRQDISGSYLGILVLAEVLYLAQAAVGVILAVQGLTPARSWVHYLYGVVTIISLPGLYAYVRGRDSQREVFLYAAMGLFLAGIALRAMTTATVALP